ncbi:MAG: DUF1152 domain-containing protein [Candidatus Helarchaeota archaeon]
MIEFTTFQYEFPNIKDKKILIVGLGGGCDIITAYGISKLISVKRPKTIIYGNTKYNVENNLSSINTHIWRVPVKQITLKSSMHTHGTTLIDQSVPRGNDGCPYIFLLRKNNRSENNLANEIKNLHFDKIFAVDTGGDSIVKTSLSGPQGRDMRMLRILLKTGVPLEHIIVAPGCDGESSYNDILNTFQEFHKLNKYKGCFLLKPIIGTLKTLAAPLSTDRTPNIIVAAYEDRLKKKNIEFAIIERENKQIIPLKWLLRGFVFIHD